jgi:hypothetical protein
MLAPKIDRDVAALALLLSASGCVPYSKGAIKVANYSDQPSVVSVQASTKDGVLKVDETFEVKAGTVKRSADGKPILDASGNPSIEPYLSTQTIEAPKSGRLQVSYRPGGSTTWFKDSQFREDVADADSFSKALLIPTTPIFDRKLSIDELAAVAAEIDAGPGKRLQSLLDIAPRLNSLLIAKQVAENVKVSFPVAFKGVVTERSANQERSVSALVNESVMVDASVNVPVYGSVKSKVETGKLYSLRGEVRHYELTNNFNLAKALLDATDDERRALKLALRLAPSGSEIYIVHSMHVITSATFSLAEGTTVSGSAEAAVASIFTAQGSYVFKHDNSSLSTLSEIVTRVDYESITSVDTLLKIIGDDGKLVSVPTSGTFGGRRVVPNLTMD